LTLSKPSACVQGDHSSKRGDHTSERERESGQLLIRSILVLLFSFEVLLKKIIKKKVAAKEKQKEMKKSNNKEGALCVFSFPLCGGALWLPLCLGSRL
jgi:hypothetical protein